NPLNVSAEYPNHYRGKIILIVDQSVAADLTIETKLERLADDLRGDGWRVLRHDVARGPELSDGLVTWAANNGPAVCEIRALIKADYDAAPAEVRAVFLIGHIAVPYSGANSIEVTGAHYSGAFPSDAFYGVMNAGFGVGGWTDTTIDHNALTKPDASWI